MLTFIEIFRKLKPFKACETRSVIFPPSLLIDKTKLNPRYDINTSGNSVNDVKYYILISMLSLRHYTARLLKTDAHIHPDLCFACVSTGRKRDDFRTEAISVQARTRPASTFSYTYIFGGYLNFYSENFWRRCQGQ